MARCSGDFAAHGWMRGGQCSFHYLFDRTGCGCLHLYHGLYNRWHLNGWPSRVPSSNRLCRLFQCIPMHIRRNEQTKYDHAFGTPRMDAPDRDVLYSWYRSAFVMCAIPPPATFFTLLWLCETITFINKDASRIGYVQLLFQLRRNNCTHTGRSWFNGPMQHANVNQII